MANLPPHEKFLRFETLPNTTQLMRARAVYMTGIAFIMMQFVNIFFMTISYGEWTIDHSISVGACLGVTLTILSLRLTKNFHLFAFIYSAMLFIGVVMSASVESIGINSALIPLIIVGAVLNGFVGGWRHIVLYAFCALCLIWGLYNISLTALLSKVVVDAGLKTLIFQRAMQASLALFMTSICTGLIVYTVTKLFNELDDALLKLNHSHQQKIDFMSHMSQGLGRPVAGINGGLKKLSEQGFGQEDPRYMHVVQTYARRLTQIISDVITLSSLDKDRLNLTDVPFDLRAEIKGLMKTYETIAKTKGLHLGTTYAAHLPEIYKGDGPRIRQVLKNLIHNAFINTQEGSVHVYVDGRLKGADEVTLRISIKDTGDGISQDDMERVFDRFSPCGRNNDPNKFTGTGMELAICHEVIAFMGGDLNVESQPGIGSNFDITLTLQVADNQSQGTEIDDASSMRNTVVSGEAA